MGIEATCVMRLGRRRFNGRALLETDHLLLRWPDQRLKIPFGDIERLEAKDGRLAIAYNGGNATLYLGAAAAKWIDKIKNPRSLMDKLGVKQGMTVTVDGVDDAAFLVELATRTAHVGSRPGGAVDIVFFGTENPASLVRLASFKRMLARDGAIWVVHRKGKGATLKDTDVFAAAKLVGLVDNKVVAFSVTHTAERLVIPLNDRAALETRQTKRERTSSPKLSIR